MPAHHEAALGELAPLESAAFELHGLALVLFGLLGHIPIPEGVVLVIDLDHRRVHVEGQGVLDIVVDHLAVCVLIGDVRAAGSTPDDLMEGHLVHIGLEAVENHQLAALELVIDQLAHVAVVAEEGGGVGKHELLVHSPVFRHGLVQQVQHPHAVILHHDPLCPGIVEPGLQVLLVEVRLVLHHGQHHIGVGKLLGGVFLLTLLTDQQQGALAVAEALVLQRLLDELGLARLQEARKQIYGHIAILIHRQTTPSGRPPGCGNRSRRNGR